MHINWDIIIKITIPLAMLILGIILNKWAEDRPRLIAYISHTSAINLKTPDGQTFSVHTHSMVVRNLGRKSAKNVRLGHQVLPNYQIYPSIDHSVKDILGGSKEIVIPVLVPKAQITINYLYYPPLIWNQINTYNKSDEGFAKPVNMILARQYSKKLSFLALLIFLVGLIALGYLSAILIKIILKAL